MLVPTPPLNLQAIARLATDAVQSTNTRIAYTKNLTAFLAWSKETGSTFNRTSVMAYRKHLLDAGKSAQTINQALSAIRKLAEEADVNGLLDHRESAAIRDIRNIRQQGKRCGYWLTEGEASKLLCGPDVTTLQGMRDHAMISLLLGGALRRGELCGLRIEQLQKREERWCLVDVERKRGRIQTIPIPHWTARSVFRWLGAAGITEGKILRAFDKFGKHMSQDLAPGSVGYILAEYSKEIGLKRLAAHDMRRTSASAMRRNGASLDSIQRQLGHASVSTTEKYLEAISGLEDAACDVLKFEESV